MAAEYPTSPSPARRRIVREREPELAADGPLQYDAAAVASVREAPRIAITVTTGRMALAEWQQLAGRLGELEVEYERLARSESRAQTRLRDALDLLDKFAEPSRGATPCRPGRLTPGGPASPRPRRDTPGVMAVRMLGVFEVAIEGRRVTHWRGQRTQSVLQFSWPTVTAACRETN